MTDRHVGYASIAASIAVVAVIVVAGGGLGPVLLATGAIVVLGVAMLTGYPVLVGVGSIGHMGGIALLVSDIGEWPAVAVAAPLVWISAEAAWRWFDLRPGIRARSTAASSWLGAVAAVAIGSAAFAVLALGVEGADVSGGLTFRVLGLLAVIGTAGILVLVANRRSQAR
jgi:hypothetical protein